MIVHQSFHRAFDDVSDVDSFGPSSLKELGRKVIGDASYGVDG